MARDGVDYHVTAHLKTVDKMSSGLVTIGNRVQALGSMVRGTTMQSAAMYAQLGAGAAALAGGAGFGVMVGKGLLFNKMMEDTRSEVATIFQMFGQNAGAMGKTNSIAEQWTANLGLAGDSMKRLYDIAKLTPGSFAQVSSLFKNAAAGLATTTMDVDRQLAFVEKAALAGGLTGGDYEVLGAQVGRILAGSAGAEMNVWKIMQKPILEAGQKLDVFGKKMQANADLTEAFNKLTGEQRLVLMETAMAGLSGPVAEYFGQTMEGIIGTTTSAIDTMTGKMTAKLYESFRQFLIRINAEGGILGDLNLDKLNQAAELIDMALTGGAEWLYIRIESATLFIANQWDTIALKLANVFDTALRAAELYVKFAAAKAFVGAGIGVVGKGISMAGGAAKGGAEAVEMIGKSGMSLAALGKAALIALPIIAAVALVLAGVGVAFAGVGAFFIENWDVLLKGLEEGTIVIEPLMQAIDTFWYTMVRIGGVFLGTNDPMTTFNALLEFATDAIYRIIGSFKFFLQAAGYIITGVDTLVRIYGFFYGAIYTGLVKLVEGVFSVMETALGKLAEWTGLDMFGDWTEQVKGAREAIGTHGDETWDGLKEMARKSVFGSEFQSKWLDAAKSMEEIDARALRGSPATSWINDMIGMIKGRKPEIEWEEFGPTMQQMQAGKKEVAGKGNVNIHTLNVIQDLRDTDPDRILAAFIDPLREMADRPKTSYFSTQQGAS